MRRPLSIALLAAWFALIPTDVVAQTPQFDGDTSTFRVEFDPGNRLRVGLGVSSETLRRGEAESAFFFGYQHSRRRGEFDEGDFWKLATTLVDGRLRWCAGRAPQLEAVAVEGVYISYSDDPHLTLPTVPPKRMWFPFNPGVQVAALDFRFIDAESWRLSVIETGLVLDVSRSARTGTLAWFGVAGSYGVQQTPRADIAHLMAPMTLGTLGFSQDWRGALYRVSGALTYGPSWSTEGGWSGRGNARLRAAATLLAINDRPLSVFAQADWLRNREDTDSLAALLGLELGFDR